MKSKLLYLLLFVIVFASACVNTKSAAPGPVPSGTFTGQFRKIHQSSKTGKLDTATASLQLTLNTTTGFAVTGDTSTVHAGSKGSYAISTTFIQFNDATYPKTGVPVKVHLSGTYEYYYDGSVFQMLGNDPADTLEYQYDMKKTTN